MGRARREIYSNHVYEICMRTRQGLPFVYTKYMKMLLKSVMARVQRDDKVTLCHYLWMANHPHIIVVAKDKQACTQFYGEIQKQLTEAIKRLLGLKYLSLWKNNATSLIPYYDLETVCYRIAYLYANPARANLVDSIKDYPGLSSWKSFKQELITQEKTPPSLSAEYSTECEWVRMPLIQRLPTSTLSKRTDSRLCEKWREKTTETHLLTLKPNAWMKWLGVKSRTQIKDTNIRIQKFLTGLESEAREKRGKKSVKGKRKLYSQPLNLSYTPKKNTRRIFIYSLDKKLRIKLIEQYRKFCEQCSLCYQRWKMGELLVKWPPGALLPPPPVIQNNFTPENLSLIV